MEVQDRIYGNYSVDEPVLVELIKTEAVQRLKNITMGGIVALLDISPDCTRYEHSLGVMYLIRKLGGSLEEQAAGLLHDISHTAFSHVIDYALGSSSHQNYHEKVKNEYVMKTEIPKICENYNLDLEFILDEERHSILEQSLPKLCADRIDYTLRDLSCSNKMSQQKILKIVERLTFNELPAFQSVDAAELFARGYMDCSESFWMNVRSCALYQLCGEAIEIALSESLISEEDFWLSDIEFWEKLNSLGSESKEIARKLELISPRTRFKVSNSEESVLRVHRKVRCVNPDVMLDEGETKSLSELSQSYADELSKFKASHQEWVDVKIL